MNLFAAVSLLEEKWRTEVKSGEPSLQAFTA
jgi:hypothetical protein